MSDIDAIAGDAGHSIDDTPQDQADRKQNATRSMQITVPAAMSDKEVMLRMKVGFDTINLRDNNCGTFYFPNKNDKGEDSTGRIILTIRHPEDLHMVLERIANISAANHKAHIMCQQTPVEAIAIDQECQKWKGQMIRNVDAAHKGTPAIIIPP